VPRSVIVAPARATIQGGPGVEGMLIEIEAVAVAEEAVTSSRPEAPCGRRRANYTF